MNAKIDGPAVPSSSYRRALNALRGVAALYVVFYHIRYYSDYPWFNSFPVLRFGYIGVDFFFILSGLIISHVYLEKTVSASPTFWKKFIWLRIARLFPVHFMIMVLLLLAALVGPLFDERWSPVSTQDVTDWISLTLLVRQWTLPDGYVWNTPAWSVSAEFFAYLFIFPIVSRIIRTSSTFPFGIVFMLTGFGLFGVMVLAAHTVNITQGVGPLIRVTAGFLLGTGLFLILRTWSANTNWDRVLVWTLVSIMPLITLLFYCARFNIPMDLLIIGYLTVLICATYQAQGKIADFLGTPIPFWMGEISFALYLCHIPILRIVSYLALWLGFDRGFFFGLSCVGIAIVTAHFLYRFIEVPSRDALRNWFEARHKCPTSQSITITSS